MSEPVPSDENLKRVREKVMQLAREIEQMSGQNIPPQIYFQEFLTRVVTAIGARAGAVWMIEDTGRLGMAAQVNLDQTGLREVPGALQLNEKLLSEVLQTGEARTIAHGGEAKLPTEHVLVLSALHKEKNCVGVVELFQRPDVPEKAQSGYMQFLEQMCGYASRFIEGKRKNQPETADAKNQFWTDFEQFTLRIQRTLDEQEVADAAASDGRSLLGVDRFSVVVRKGRSTTVRAVSGQSSVNHRSNLIVAMAKLAQRVIEMGETLVYTGKIDGLPPQIEQPLANFVQESGSRMVMLVPTYESEPMVHKQGEEEERKRRVKRPKATGCIVVEQIAESEVSSQLEQRAELLADHIGAALWNARQHSRILGMKLWKILGTGMEWFHGRKLAITLAVLTGIALIAAAGTFYRLEYPVDAEGKLMPKEQYAVFAKWDGEITREGLKVRGGERVKAGQVLVVMVNDELDEQIRSAEAEVRKQDQLKVLKTSELAGARSAVQRDGSRGEDVVARISVELTRAQADLEIAKNQLSLLENRRQEKLTIVASHDGIIPNFQLRQMLEDRPVRQGDHLFDIMNDEGQWHMELLVPEKRMGHILRTQRSRLESGKSPEESLRIPGNFYLATQPDNDKLKCHLTSIATRSTTDTEMGTAFELLAEADDGQELPEKRIGAEVTVRIYCNETSLAYYCFGDVYDFILKYLWL
ncbi:MAG: hypothetical protein KDA91_12330 [Planctomycetaceae bacterium]|nr:hypothetical protein [Planctomycetaceae bacterium]